ASAAADRVSAAPLQLDTTGFLNPLGNGYFWLSTADNGSSLYLNFSPVPEPSTLLLAAVGSFAMFVARRRWRSACRTHSQ
ncbi:MAG: PEP-CTERM sorting domain-containing protein, partial [Planctomycetaceae bacterium]|nr:PEP-CTERM sorting domain-containing protein [Planctomycetaceae bacterium]